MPLKSVYLVRMDKAMKEPGDVQDVNPFSTWMNKKANKISATIVQLVPIVILAQ